MGSHGHLPPRARANRSNRKTAMPGHLPAASSVTPGALVTAQSASWAEHFIFVAKTWGIWRRYCEGQHFTLVPTSRQLTGCLRTETGLGYRRPPAACEAPSCSPRPLARHPIPDLPLPSSGLAPQNQPSPSHTAPRQHPASAWALRPHGAAPALLRQGPLCQVFL